MKPINVDYEVRGANHGVYGQMKVGKSFFTKLLNYYFYVHSNMPVVILDHNVNEYTYGIKDEYGGFFGEIMPNGTRTPIVITLDQFYDMNWAYIPRKVVFRVQKNRGESTFDFDKFFSKCTELTYTVINLDDLGDVFGNQATPIIKNFPGTTINNSNQVFYQFHRLMQGFPFLRDKLQKIILKSVPPGGTIPDDFLVPADQIRFFIDEIEKLNEPLPFRRKFAWRIINAEDGLVTMPKKVLTNGEPEEIVTYVISEYIKNAKKR